MSVYIQNTNQMDVKKKTAFYIVMALMPFIVLESCARIYVHIIKNHELRDHYTGGKAFEFYPPTYIKLRPDTLVTNVPGKACKINSEGLLNDTFGDASDQYIKVMALGGSTSFFRNYMLKLKHIYESDTENNHIKAKFASAGTPGYTTYQTLVCCQMRLLRQKPDIIIVYHGINDLLPLTIKGVKPDCFFDYIKKQSSISGKYINYRDTVFDNSAFYTLAYNQILGIKLKWRRHFYSDKEINSLDSFRENIESLIGIAKIRNIDVVLVTFAHNFVHPGLPTASWGLQEEAAKGIQRHNEILRELAHRHQVELVDMAEIISDREDFFTDFCHFTPLGRDQFANIIYPAVKKLIRKKIKQKTECTT